ncbi:hypothetical protein [Vibrio sp. SCSIO 43137]|uniref:hypothetical protein n=1 Tax=Vibrio sp. SCSIO 43137 TaxID=3021011 RepID=UPI002307BF48|nr:hypothetical protein [Vibrio sp. SCSIO 43137]WCE32252.1 hypothetical protein PK654_17300 [Vibrio sp. SCSIO 43137]
MKLLQIALLCVAIAAGFFAQDLLQTAKPADTSTTSEFDKEKYCFLSTSECQQAEVSMLLDRDVAKPLTESLITIKWDNAENDTLSLNLNALEMDMGTVKYQLKKQQDGLFTAKIMLPVCVQDKMTWLGDLSDGTTTVHPAIRMER